MTSNKPDTWQRLQELFATAIELEGAQRDAFVEQSCGSDDGLRGQLEKLLADFEPSARELDRSHGAVAASGKLFADSLLSNGDHVLPTRIGQYAIKDVIASGGMGTVYEAEQENPRRTVAVKVMRLAIDSRRAVQRFKHESQVLARMRHPGIAQVLEAGIHQDATGATPFFAMEYVPGAQTITEYSDTNAMSLRQRLELFVQVCDAVAHGHQKGVIHRDLKPANVLVDEAGDPKIIDFGVARSTDADIAATTMLTDVGQLIGTLQYMSPEQCAADPLDIDMRSDIYALGIILYELLCRKLPYDVTNLAVGEATRVVREAPVPRLSTSDARLRGDLETIVGKALQKNRDHRYESVVHLADDIRRYLNGQAILARPPSINYQLRVFARRHKGLVAGIAGVIVTLVLGIIGTGMGLVREHAAKEEAIVERDNANQSLYRSLVGEARAIRVARGEAYRKRVFDLLTRARQLNTSNLNLDELRNEAVMSMGDFRGFEPTDITDFPAAVRVIDLDASGRRLAVGTEKGTILIHDSRTGLETARLLGHQAPLRAIRFARSADRFISVDNHGMVKTWQTDNPDPWEPMRTFQVDPSTKHVVITDDGNRLVAAGKSSVSIWSLTDERCIGTYDSGGANLHGAAVSPDQRFLAAGYDSPDDGDGRDGILVWDVAERKILRRLPSTLSYVYDVAFSPDSQLLACACNTGLVIWTTPDFSQHARTQSATLGQTLFCASGEFLATCADNRTILWDVTTGKEIANLRHGTPWGLSINADGTVIGSHNGDSVRIWNLAAADERLTLRGGSGRSLGLAFSPDGNALASGNVEARTKLWNLANQQATHGWIGPDAAVNSIAFSPDGRLVATSRWAKESPRIWDVQTQRELIAPEHDIGPLEGVLVAATNCVAFDRSGRYFAACGNGMALWRVERNADGHGGIQLELQRLTQLPGRRSLYLCFGPDSNVLAWVNANRQIRLWDVDNSRELPFAGSKMRSGWNGLAFFPDGERLMYLTSEGSAEVWNVTTGKKDFVLGGPGVFDGSAVALSQDGRFFAAMREWGTLSIWDARIGNQLFLLPEETNGINRFSFSPDGEQLAVGLATGEIHVWSLPKIRSQLASIGLDWIDG